MHSTSKTIAIGILLGFLITAPFFDWVWNKDWELVQGFPLGWLGIGLVYMATFFHELGHTLFAWFYGYPTLPSFDFQHGGGMAWMLGEQNIFLFIFINSLLLYGAYRLRESKFWFSLLAGLGVFNFFIGLTDFHQSVINFMGPGAEPLIAGFFLIRALFDLAPRGYLERVLNAVFGFALIFRAFVESYGLLQSEAFRLVYFQQKGQHGFGDFDKIANALSFAGFNGVVYIWAGLTLICLIVPFILYAVAGNSVE